MKYFIVSLMIVLSGCTTLYKGTCQDWENKTIVFEGNEIKKPNPWETFVKVGDGAYYFFPNGKCSLSPVN